MGTNCGGSSDIREQFRNAFQSKSRQQRDKNREFPSQASGGTSKPHARGQFKTARLGLSDVCCDP